MNDSPLSATLAEARYHFGARRTWIVLVGAGLLLGLVGPFGTYEDLSLALRLGYWLLIVPPVYGVGFLASYLAASWCEDRGMAQWVAIGAGGFAAAVPVTLMLVIVHLPLFGASPFSEAARLFPYVLVIAVAFSVVAEVFADGEVDPPSTERPGEGPQWLDHLPKELGRDLILLEAQDHYLRAETSCGEALVRASLQDATDALGAFGVRTHRSWWVARHAIERLAYRKGALVVVLAGGQNVPIGRTYRNAVRQALQ